MLSPNRQQPAAPPVEDHAPDHVIAVRLFIPELPAAVGKYLTHFPADNFFGTTLLSRAFTAALQIKGILAEDAGYIGPMNRAIILLGVNDLKLSLLGVWQVLEALHIQDMTSIYYYCNQELILRPYHVCPCDHAPQGFTLDALKAASAAASAETRKVMDSFQAIQSALAKFPPPGNDPRKPS